MSAAVSAQRAKPAKLILQSIAIHLQSGDDTQ